MMVAEGIASDVRPSDWRYYSEKIKKAKFDLDEQELKPYFSLDNVTQGVFMVCDKLYGLQFKKLENVPVYHQDVTAWQVLEKDGAFLGIIYMDFHPRASKRGGADDFVQIKETVNGKELLRLFHNM